MVSNYDRIYAEITKEAEQLASECGVDPTALVDLVLEIVDLEDQHRIKPIRIRQLIEERILATAVAQLRHEGT